MAMCGGEDQRAWAGNVTGDTRCRQRTPLSKLEEEYC